MYHSGGDVDNGGGYAASIWETSVPSPQFCCEPKNCSLKSLKYWVLPRACHTEWSKSEREKQIVYINRLDR